MKFRDRFVRAAALALLPVVASCGAVDGRVTPPALEDTAWILESLSGANAVPESQVTLRFTDGKVQGSDGCNRYSAIYESDEDGFRIPGTMASTQMACPEPVMKQAAAFLAALAAARSARTEGGRLLLRDEGGKPLATLRAQSEELAGSAWRISACNNGKQAVASVVQGSTLTLRFDPGGRISGSAGCNRYTGTYTASGKSVTIGKTAVTRMMCDGPQGVMEQEGNFLRALEKVSVARVEGSRLELRSEDGALQVSAERSVEEPASRGAAQPAPGALGLVLPATFRGDLPCADCETIRHHLDLWPDGVFHLRRIWVGRDLARDELGRFRIDESRRALVLEGGGEMPLQLEVKGSNRLRKLDMEGKPIQSQLPYELVSDGTLAPTDLSLFLAGEMRYMADAARFTECRTGRSYPIVQEADFIALERGYREAVREPGAPLYVTFEGEIAPRPKMEGEGLETSVVVRRFIRAWPDRKCGA